MGGALEGIRVLDLGLLVQGPQAGQLFVDLGADVIKVEVPEVGDHARWIPVAPTDPRSAYLVGCNRGKRSLTVDLRTDEGRELALRIAEQVDVMISNFRPGTLEGWGLGYEEVAARNPRIVYGQGSTFGFDGPDAKRPGADLAGQAAGGLILQNTNRPDEVRPVNVTIADHIGSQNLANGVLAALVARERTGRGQKVQVSLLGGQIYAQASEYSYTFLTGKTPPPEHHGHSLIPFLYGVFPTADGSIAIVGFAPTVREAFYKALGRPDLIDDERFDGFIEVPDRELLWQELAKSFRTKTSAEWFEILEPIDVRYAPVRDYLQVAQDEAVFENGYLQRVDHPDYDMAVGSPIRMSDTPATPGVAAPELGQHTEELLLEFGLEWEEIERLRAAGVI